MSNEELGTAALLKPCPWCGAEIEYRGHDKSIYCDTCGYKMYSPGGQDIIAWWNTRFEEGKEGGWLRPDVREAVAALCHKQWSGWMEYLFGKCEILENAEKGTLAVIPEWAVQRWKRQMETAFADLSENEKESDRTEADIFLAILQGGEEESLYCIALLKTLKIEDTNRVLTEYNRLKGEPKAIEWVRQQQGGESNPSPPSRDGGDHG